MLKQYKPFSSRNPSKRTWLDALYFTKHLLGWNSKYNLLSLANFGTKMRFLDILGTCKRSANCNQQVGIWHTRGIKFSDFSYEVVSASTSSSIWFLSTTWVITWTSLICWSSSLSVHPILNNVGWCIWCRKFLMIFVKLSFLNIEQAFSFLDVHWINFSIHHYNEMIVLFRKSLKDWVNLIMFRDWIPNCHEWICNSYDSKKKFRYCFGTFLGNL